MYKLVITELVKYVSLTLEFYSRWQDNTYATMNGTWKAKLIPFYILLVDTESTALSLPLPPIIAEVGYRLQS